MGNKTTRAQEQAHICQFTKKDKILEYMIPRNAKCARFRRKFRGMFLISEENGRKCFNQMSTTGYIFEKERHLTHHYYMIHPYSKFREYWETIVIVEILYIFTIFTILKVILNPDVCSKALQFMALLFDLFEMSDIILRFFTGFVNKTTQTITLNTKKVFRNTIKSRYLIVDLIGAFPFRFIFYNIQAQSECPKYFLQYWVFIKIVRMRIFHVYIVHKAKIHQWTDRCYQGVLIFIWISIGCCWFTALYYTMLTSNSTQKSWLNKFDIKESYNKYFMTFYFVFSILMLQNGLLGTVEINDFRDMAFCSVILIVAYLGSAIFLGMFVFAYGLRKNSKIKYYEMVQAVKKYMIHKDLPKDLQKKILEYYEFKFQRTFFRESDIHATINVSLRNEISYYCGSYMYTDKESVFSKLPKEIIALLCVAMKPRIYMTNDIIANAGEETKRMFIIGCGTIAVYSPTGQEIDHLHEGSQFGLVMLIKPDNQYLFTYVALEPCELFTLTYSDFVSAIGDKMEYMEIVVKAVTKKKDMILKYLKKERNTLDFDNMDSDK